MPAGLWGRPGKIGQIDHALQMHLQYSTVEFIRLWEKNPIHLQQVVSFLLRHNRKILIS